MSAKKEAERTAAEGTEEPFAPEGGAASGSAERAAESGPETGAAPEPAAQLADMRAALEQARADAAERLDQFLRAKAESENTRRRAEIDVANAHRYGVERFATELLPVRDSLELARSVDIQQESATALAKMHEGLDLTLKLMDTVFEKFGLVVIDPQNEKFDPERHQAMGMVPSKGVPPGHVLQVMQKGYLLRDRLLRPALVIVAVAPEGEGPGTRP